MLYYINFKEEEKQKDEEAKMPEFMKVSLKKARSQEAIWWGLA